MLVPSYLQVEVVTIMSKQNQEQVPVLNISEALLARSDKTFKPKEADKPKKDNVFKLTGVGGLLANQEDPDSIETISEVKEEADTGLDNIPSLESIDEQVHEVNSGLDQDLSEEKDLNQIEDDGLVWESDNETDEINEIEEKNIETLEVPQDQSEENKELELQIEKVKVLDNLVSEMVLNFDKLEDTLTEVITKKVLELTSQAIGEKIDSLPEIIKKKIDRLCSEIISGNENIKVFLSEADYEIVKESLPMASENINFTIDTELSRGEVRVRTENLEIQDDLSSRLVSNNPNDPLES